MKRTWIIARREYLSYVATWGFWVSLAMAPLFIAVALGLPALMARSTPERPFAVIAQDERIVEAVDAAFAMRRAEAAVNVLVGLAETAQGPETAARLREMADRGAAPDEAARGVGLSEGLIAQGLSAIRRQYIRVPPPASDAEALRPYLTGERAVPGWEGRGPLYAAIVVRRGADGQYEMDYWSANLTNPSLRNAIAGAIGRVMRDDALRSAAVDPMIVTRADLLRPQVRDLSPEKAAGAEEVTVSDRMPFMLGVGAGFILWSVVFSVANMLLTSTIEEKSNKILEVLLSSARLWEILAGKLLGVAGVSFTLLAVWLVAGAGVTSVIGAASPQLGGTVAQVVSGVLNPGLLLPFLFYFICGYLMYGAIFLAVGALCETMQEAQTLMSPLLIVLMAPVLLLSISMADLDSPLLGAAVWAPLFTPFLMLPQLAQDPPLWKLAGTSALMLATLFGTIWLGARVFRAGALGQARPGSLMKAFRRA